MAEETTEVDILLAEVDHRNRERLFADLFMKHRSRMRAMVELRLDRRLQGRVDPSDVVQEVYLEAARRLGEYLDRRPMPLYLWLRFLAGQRLQLLRRHHLKLQKRSALREVSLYRQPMPGASSAALSERFIRQESSPGSTVERNERRLRILEAIESMESLDREILALRYFEELSSAEAADLLGISKDAARQRYFRALKRLKKILAASGDGGRKGMKDD